MKAALAEPQDVLGRDDLTALMLRVRDHKDREAFAGLFEHFAPRLKSFLMRQGAHNDEAEEFVQETMLSVWRSADRFDPAKAAVSTWIFTIARNKKIDAARRKTAVTTDLDAAMDVESEDTADTLAQAMTLDAQQGQLREALKTLPDEQKDLLMRSFFDAKSHGEISTETGIPLGTVKSRIRLGLERLRRAIGPKEAA